jgi:hypothetical protein
MRRAGLTEDDLADINAENRKKNAVSLLDRALAATNNENVVDENDENSDATNNDDDDSANSAANNSGGNGSNLGVNNSPNTRNRVKRNIKLPGATKTPIN